MKSFFFFINNLGALIYCPLLYVSLLVLCAFRLDANLINVDQTDIKYIYDGDTFFLVCPDCPKGKLGFRVMGVDTPELEVLQKNPQ